MQLLKDSASVRRVPSVTALPNTETTGNSGGSATLQLAVAVNFQTMITIVFGVGSRSTPVLLVPPLSLTWKVKLAYGTPVASVAGANFRRPMSAASTKLPATSAGPPTLSVPAAGAAVIVIPVKLFAGVS